MSNQGHNAIVVPLDHIGVALSYIRGKKVDDWVEYVLNKIDHALAQGVHPVMTLRLEHYFSFIYLSPPSSSLFTVLWILSLCSSLCLMDCVPPLPYRLHTLPSPLLYHLRVHQYLLMCTLGAPSVPASPHRCLMYHCTVCARFPAP